MRRWRARSQPSVYVGTAPAYSARRELQRAGKLPQGHHSVDGRAPESGAFLHLWQSLRVDGVGVELGFAWAGRIGLHEDAPNDR